MSKCSEVYLKKWVNYSYVAIIYSLLETKQGKREQKIIIFH